MGSKKVSLRISKIVNFSNDSYDNIYDLCCDHGKIGYHLHKRFPQVNIILVDQVKSIVEEIKDIYSDIPKAKFYIQKEDCTKLKIKSNSKSLYILAGIGGDLAFKIYKNIYKQDNDGSFLFCLNQGVEDLRLSLIDEGQKIFRESFFIENKHGYHLFLIQKNAPYNLSIFNPDVYDFESKLHKKYIKSLLDYYQLKSNHSAEVKYAEYHDTLKEIFTQFK